MYHRTTDDKTKEKIQQSFATDTGVKVLFATVAFGMGVDVKGCHCVIHYSLPKNSACYFQESGRCGRDGQPSHAVLIKHRGWRDARTGSTKEMLGYGGSTHCRREQLLSTFDFSAPERSDAAHTCCDTCAAKCMCGGSGCDEENGGRGFVEVELLKVKAVTNSRKSRLKVREVPKEASDAFQQELMIYRSGLLNAAGKTEGLSLYMGDDVACGVPLDLIKDVVMDVCIIKDFDHLVKSYHFFNSNHAEHVWKLFTEIILVGATHDDGLAAIAGLAAMTLSSDEDVRQSDVDEEADDVDSEPGEIHLDSDLFESSESEQESAEDTGSIHSD